MKLTCTQENLSHGLQLVSHIASKNVSLPILNNVLLKAEKGILSLLTTNLEIGVICSVRGKIEKEGSFTVQAKTLNDYINLLPKENVELGVYDGNLRIECKNAKTVMKGLDSSEFPLIPEVDAIFSYEIKTLKLKEALTAVGFAVAYDETRPEISGVYFSFKNDELTVVATDSYRLAEKKISLEKKGEAHHVIVPARTIQELIRILGEEPGIITIQSNENQIVFTFNEVKLTSRVIEGQYPDYRQIIPEEHRTKATVHTNELINTVKRASLFCKPGGNDIKLTFNTQEGVIDVTAVNLQVGESEARQEASIEGEDNSIIFNYRFLLDGLQNINSPECILETTTNTNPGLLKPAGQEGGYVYIIMPIKQ